MGSTFRTALACLTVLVGVALALGYVSRGPRSFRAEHRRHREAHSRLPVAASR